MNLTHHAIRRLVAIVAISTGGFLMTSCEEHNSQTVNVYDSPQTSSSPSSSYSSSSPTSGSWSGVSATGQVSSKLSLSESGGSISGTLNWPGGDTRSVSGKHNGGSVTLYISGGDTWKLSYSGKKLSGTGYKPEGGSYNVSFTRK